MFLTWCPGLDLEAGGVALGEESLPLPVPPASWDRRLWALAPCPPALSRRALRPACDLPLCSLLLLGPWWRNKCVGAAGSGQDGAAPGRVVQRAGWGQRAQALRGTKGRLGSEGRHRCWVGWGVILLYLSWKQSPLFFHKLWEKPHPLPPHLCKPSPFPRSLQAGDRCPRATAWESISVCKPLLGGGGYPEMPPSSHPGSPRGGTWGPRGSLGRKSGFSKRWDLGCGSSEEADGARGGPGLRPLRTTSSRHINVSHCFAPTQQPLCVRAGPEQGEECGWNSLSNTSLLGGVGGEEGVCRPLPPCFPPQTH